MNTQGLFPPKYLYAAEKATRLPENAHCDRAERMKNAAFPLETIAKKTHRTQAETPRLTEPFKHTSAL